MNFMNIFAGLLAFIIGFVMLWFTWEPVITMTAVSALGSQLSLFIRLGYVIVISFMMLFMPYNLIFSDDEGNV